MKYLIVGRSGTGKDKLREILEDKYGFTFVKSASTRKPRFEGEDTHEFITHEEAASVPDSEKVAVTHIKNGDIDDEYFARRSTVEQCDAYIIDPIGVKQLLKNMPDTIFELVYIKAPDKETQKEMAIQRSNNPEQAAEIFEKRYASEDAEFKEFEESITNKTFGADNCKLLNPFTNDYTEPSIEQFAFELYKEQLRYNRLELIINDLIENGSLYTNDNGEILVAMMDKTQSNALVTVPMSHEQYIQLILTDHEGMADTMNAYLGIPQITTLPDRLPNQPDKE